MGRYRAHQFDDEDDDDDDEYDGYHGHDRSVPIDMDWTVIPNDDENVDEDELMHHASASGRDVNAAYRDFIPSPPPIDDNEDEHDDNFTNDNLRRWDGMVEEAYYLEQRYFEQRYLALNQYVPTRKRSRIRTSLFIVVAFLVAIIAIALKRYAPPPPQTSLFTIVPPLTVSTDTDTDDGFTFAASDLHHQGDVAHHATWGDYSRHLSHVLHHAVVHVLSVAWYAISNSLRSAYDDLKVSWTELLSKYGWGDDSDTSTSASTSGRKWSTALESRSIVQSSILDFSNWLSQIQAMGVVLGDTFHRATHDFQQQQQQHEDGDLGGWALLFSKYGWNDSAGERTWSTSLERFVQSSTGQLNTLWTQMQTSGVDRGGNSRRAEHDIQHHEAEDIDDKVSACLIRVPAASNRLTQLTGSDASANHHHWSTEDHLRQKIGTSLSPQNLALKIISERMDEWGKELVEVASIPLLSAMSSAVATVRSNDYEMSFLIDKVTLSEWILPPAIGFLVVGNAGVGKRTIARRLSHFLLGHCLNSKASSKHDDIIDGVLEVGMSDLDNNDPIHERAQSIKEIIVNHIHRREGLGSVVTLRHVESMPTSIVTEILQVLHGTSHSLNYQTSDNELVEANCNGTVFVMTSKVWGSNSIVRHLEQGNSWNVLRSREALTSSILRELDSYLETIISNIANPTTVVPILPFQPDDVASILQSRVHALSVQYQEIVWKRIEISLAAIRYFTGVDYITYSDLHTIHDDHYAISTLGAHALDDNVLLHTLEDMTKPDVRKHPDMILRIGLDDTSNDATFRWCHTVNGVEGCEAM